MKKMLILVLSVLLVLSCTAMADPAVITVRGTGVVSLDADTATINLGVREISKDVVEAQADVNRKIAGVIEKLKEMGIDASKIHTYSISIYPEYNYDSTSLSGYSAETSISIETTDIENVGKYIDAAFESGANTFSDVSFTASEMTEESNQALTLAIQQAFDKARVMAQAIGADLGALKSVDEAEYSYADSSALYDKAMAAEDAGSGTQVYASPLQVSATVTAQFELESAD
ncbi:MAG: SIMPL domain-containing protein [Clostridia bacterium]|nr:SIMPL domain-containing protein [Clostridia bacterium]